MSFTYYRGYLPARAALIFLMFGVALACLGGISQAATPAWKLLAVTGPSNLPPRQSEVQRLTVEADGGSFQLGRREKVATSGKPIVSEVHLALTAGSTTATVESIRGKGQVEIGDRISTREPGYEGTTIVSCSGTCGSPGTTLELSEPASVSATGAVRLIYTRELELVSGRELPQVGAEIVRATNENGEPGLFSEFFPAGTTITALGPNTFKLSNPTSAEYNVTEGYLNLTTGPELTPAIPYGSPASMVQSQLEALPSYGSGSVAVAGSGSVEDPYLIEYAGEGGHGPLALRNVSQLEVDSSGLTGALANANVLTTVPGGPGTGEIDVFATNIGGAPTKGRTTVTIGPLPAGIAAAGPGGGGEGAVGIWKCSGASTIVCTSETPVSSLQPATTLRLPIEVEPTEAASSSVPIEISGGGSQEASFQLPVVISPTSASFATRAYWAGSFDEEGKLETQAGGHPKTAQTFFILNTVRSASGQIVPAGLVKNVEVELPPGLIGDPLVTPRCPQDQLAAAGEELAKCNSAMEVGRFEPVVYSLQGNNGIFYTPIYNDVPAKGAAAQFTTQILFPFQSLFGSVRSAEDFGVTVTAPNVANVVKLFGSYAALEGGPAGALGKTFLTNPTDCVEQAQSPPVANLRLEAYELPGVLSSTAAPVPAVDGCGNLQFTPSFAFLPSSTQGSSSVGATADLRIPQQGLTNPNELAQPDLKKAVVTLPEGVTVNPSSANGLAACTEAQIGYEPKATPNHFNPTIFNENPVTCPAGSKLGTVRVKTPLLDESGPGEELTGTIYLAAQEENPFHTLIAIYLVIENERYGLSLKLPGKVESDPTTGRLTATFDDNPQVPFEELILQFRGGGPRATLATPEVCGRYKTMGSLEPWSAPESGPPVQIQEAGFVVNTGCSGSAAARPFAPTLNAGTTATRAGAYSPLVIKVSRSDGEQELKSLNFSLPEGLLGKLAGIPYCPDSSIAAAKAASGRAEIVNPSCPAASRIGSTNTAAGVGSEPFHVPGSIYLAGPYEGAPLSSVVISPAVAGPFDLGDVVVRAPLFVDPESARITAKSDPIPVILKGIPLKVRSVSIDLDRPNFTLNPTSCDPMRVTAVVDGSDGASATPSNRFQVGHCKDLKFRPRLRLTLKGSTRRTGFPAVRAVLTYPKHGNYANIARAQVNLPHSEFFEQNNLNKICTKPVLLEQKCPKKTIYGRAKAWSPLLDKPLEGPVYVVGGFGYKLPALVADLSGQIRILLKGKVDSGPNGGIRNTFEAVPDAPVSRFVLELKGGKKYGLLINSENLCAKPQRAIARFTGQNGKVDSVKPLIGNNCGVKRQKAKRHSR